MKKILFLTLSLFCILTLNAQNIGLKFGLNLAGLNFGHDLQSQFDAVDAESKTMMGLTGGVSFAFELSETVDLDVGLSFTQRGNTWSIPSFIGDGNDELSRTLNFIDIAPLFKFNYAGDFSVLIGPYVGYAISGTDDVYEIDNALNYTIVTEPIEDFEAAEINTLDYGLNFGASYVINDVVDIRAGYSLGFANLNAAEDQEDVDVSTTSNGLYLTVGYLF
jgi:hypothetical protein